MEEDDYAMFSGKLTGIRDAVDGLATALEESIGGAHVEDTLVGALGKIEMHLARIATALEKK